MMRSNHDCQFLFTKNHALSVIHYVMKYISKPEDSLHSQLAVAAAVRKSISTANINRSADFDLGKSMLIKTSNKLASHREVGLPEIISHLLDFPDHYTDAIFRKVHTTQLLKYITFTYGDDPSADLSIDLPADPSADPSANSSVDEDEDPAPISSQDDPEPQSEIITSKGQFTLVSKFDDYALRGDDLAECCLYDYCSLFYKKKTQSGGFTFHDDHKQSHTHRQFYTDPAIPTLLGKLLFVHKNSSDPEIRRQYFALVSALFIPWSHTNPLKRPDVSWEHTFYEHLPTLSSRIRRYIDNLDLLHKTKEESRIDRLQQRAQHDDDDEYSADINPYIPDFDDFDDLDDDEEYSQNVERIIALLKEIGPELYIHEAMDASWDNNYFHAAPDKPVHCDFDISDIYMHKDSGRDV